MTWLLLFLPAAVLVMAFAAQTVWRQGRQADSSAQLEALAGKGCRLGVISSLMLAISGFGCFDGLSDTLGTVMIVLGLVGATTGLVALKQLSTKVM